MRLAEIKLKRYQVRRIRMRKLLIGCLILFCCFSVFAEGQQEVEQNFELTPPGELPIVTNVVGERPTLTLYITSSPSANDFENNEFTKWLEEKTGINLDFVAVPTHDGAKKLNILMASGEYPDVITGTNVLSPAQIKMYGEEGVLIELNDLIEKYGVETKKLFNDYPAAQEIATFEKGRIYSLPQVSECYHCLSPCKMWVYKPWLDKLGLDVPTTTEEFKEMLIAFKTQDPNGNGKADEIPMMGSKSGWHNNAHDYLMNSFTYYSSEKKGLYLKDGKVQSSYLDEGWKECFAYINSLVEEKLIATESWTQEWGMIAKSVESTPHIVGCVPSGWQGMFCQISNSDKWKDYISIAPLKGPKGVQNATYLPYTIARHKWMITEKCKYPEIAFRLADFMYTHEANLRHHVGRLGIEWDYLPEDTDLKDLRGQKAKVITHVVCDKQPANITWNAAGIFRNCAERRNEVAATPSTVVEIVLAKDTKENYMPYAVGMDTVIPPLLFTESEAEQIALIESDIQTYMEEAKAKFALGIVDVNEVWDSYLEELRVIGINRYLALQQAAYDRKVNQ